MAERELFWNVPLGWLVYFGIALAFLLGYVIYRRVKLWRRGGPDDRSKDLGKRIWAFIGTAIVDGFIHRRILRDPYPGIMHFLIFWGCVVLLMGAAYDFVTHYLLGGVSGLPYLLASLIVDVLGVLVLIGVIIAAIRRYIQRPKRLDSTVEDAGALSLIFLVVLTGFLVEGLRMAATELVPHPDWAVWSPGGLLFAWAFAGLGRGVIITAHGTLWWIHVGLAFGGIAWVCLSFSKLSHILISPVNVFFRNLGPKGALKPIPNIETAETWGVEKLEDFTWKQLLDLDACTRCGRCQDNCPAYLSGKPLSPKKVILDLKRHMTEKGAKSKVEGDNPGPTLIGDVIKQEEIWACTTCRACMEHCPVFIEHIDKIVDMRRNLVMALGSMPETVMGTLKCLEQRGHTCRGTLCARTEVAPRLQVKELAEQPEVDILYFAGCAAALEDRNIKICTAMGQIFKAAQVNYAVLGSEETCCGDPARRLGNEYLFQMLAQQNIETFKRYNPKKIVTLCPHCYNTIKNEYPQFGGDFEVVHHSQFLAELIRSGQLKLTSPVNATITYHDSCYLGRYNDVYEEPRQVVKAVPGARLVEMGRSRRHGLCCGAGGGHMWIEEEPTQRVNMLRIEDMIKTRADIVATACPYCVQMFDDAIKAKGMDESLKAMDLSELVSRALPKS